MAKLQSKVWPVYLVAVCTFISGLAGTFQPLLVRLSKYPKLFNLVVPYELYHLSGTIALIFGYILIFLSLNLLRRKRRAWLVAVLLTLLSALLQLAHLGSEHLHQLAGIDLKILEDLPTYSFVPPLVAFSALIYWRGLYTVKSEQRTLKSAINTVLVSMLAVIFYGALGFFLLDKKDFGIDFALTDSILRTIKELTLVGNPDLTAHTRYGGWFLDSLRIYGIVALSGIIYSAFRPVHYYLSTRPRERELAAKILDQCGRTSLDKFKLLPDKSYFFNQQETGFIAYKTEMAVAIALGDATAPAEQMQNLIEEFTIFCHLNGWLVAFLQTTPDYLAAYKSAGLRSLKVGEDGIVDIEQFVSKTINKKTFKSVVKKFDKDGFSLVKYEPPHSEALLTEVESISNQWLSLPGRRERGFSLGQFSRQDLQTDNLYVLRNAQNEGVAFVNQIRSYTPKETTIDMMRYCANAPNGTMDCLFAKLLMALHTQGYKYFSLGLSALSGVGDEPDDSLHEKAMHQVYEHFNRFFSYKGLRTYKAKFEPRWEERYLIYEGSTAQLIKTGLAIARATEK
ncbi:MAG: DUF2156 domain-containing protein [Candidatus Obscuribacter sp.]|nr:DUF2156 domain-containing protein [Candidatus Obscuribacter sp.]MBP6592681.1 DUF2156 domain-containing protein [Candidatus Obscuribacter sp.]